MKTRIKMIGLFSVVAIMISLLAVGYLMARPNDAPSGAVAGTVTLTGGFTNLSLKTFYSDKTGKNIVTVTIRDADLSSVRTGTVVYGVASPVNVNADPLFTISGADGVSIGAGAVGVLQGETEVTVQVRRRRGWNCYFPSYHDYICHHCRSRAIRNQPWKANTRPGRQRYSWQWRCDLYPRHHHN